MKRVLFLIIVLVLTSCEKSMDEAELLGVNANIVGTWVENGNEDDINLFERAEILDHSKYGFTINENGTFIERKNAGWCATSPITYDNFEGDWEAVSDSLLEINVGYWGGTMTYQMRIVFLDQDSLVIRYLYANSRADSR